MQAVIVYDSRYGNTEAVAEAIAEGLYGECEARLVKAAAAQPADLAADLLIVGAPTHNHRASDTMTAFLDGLPRRTLRNVRAVAFDTRYRMSRWMTGSAALVIYRKLRRAGATLIDEPQSFFVLRDHPEPGTTRRHDLERLEQGELERAHAWASELLAHTNLAARL